MKKTFHFAILAAVFGVLPLSAEVDCIQLSAQVKQLATSQPDAVLELVAKQVAESPSCACEIVKAAIEGSSASATTVAKIVEAAVTAAPEQMRLISQCAVAVAPDAIANVQAVIAKFDPNTGESAYSAKSAKSSKEAIASDQREVASMGNPLDYPGGLPPLVPGGPGGPGTPGGPEMPGFDVPIIPPIVIIPPVVSDPNPPTGGGSYP